MSTNNSMFRKTALVLVAATGLATAFVATAQPGPGFGPGMMGMRGGPMFASANSGMGNFPQERIAQLKLKLAITPEQQPAWDAFAAKAGEQARSMESMRKEMSASTAPEKMKQRQQFMAERQKSMASMSEAFDALYAVLTPQQREFFDQAYGPMQRRG